MLNEKDREKCQRALNLLPIDKISEEMIIISEAHNLDLDDVFNEMIIYFKATLMKKKESGKEDELRNRYSEFEKVMKDFLFKK